MTVLIRDLPNFFWRRHFGFLPRSIHNPWANHSHVHFLNPNFIKFQFTYIHEYFSWFRMSLRYRWHRFVTVMTIVIVTVFVTVHCHTLPVLLLHTSSSPCLRRNSPVLDICLSGSTDFISSNLKDTGSRIFGVFHWKSQLTLLTRPKTVSNWPGWRVQFHVITKI